MTSVLEVRYKLGHFRIIESIFKMLGRPRCIRELINPYTSHEFNTKRGFSNPVNEG